MHTYINKLFTITLYIYRFDGARENGAKERDRRCRQLRLLNNNSRRFCVVLVVCLCV